jgi:quercetin dioxygenase-like cupin family protein
MNDHAPMLPRPAPALRGRLLERARCSRVHEAQFHTVRRDAGAWQPESDGVRIKPLARTGVARSFLVELAPQAWLPMWPGFSQAELVFLEGSGQVGALALEAGAAACVPHAGAPALRAHDAGATLFLRLSCPPRPPHAPVSFPALHGEQGWQDFCRGVRIKPLWDGGERRSLLVRMRPGAWVGGHAHALEEECMMIDGEAFVGDTLLRRGEYQLAPAGSRHGAVTTDVGALFFVHGALDPAAYA